MQATVTNHTEYHHTPDYSDHVDCHGMTIRQALRALRGVDYGNIGGTHQIDLSDGTWMQVELTPSCDGSRLMSSQRCVRYEYDNHSGERQVAVYPIAS